MDLSNLSGGSNKKSRKRIGRGNSSGWGRTAGKGEKGQNARSGGGVPAWFEGGQMPLYRRVPKIGFRSLKNIRGLNRFNIVTLGALERFDAGTTVDIELLKTSGLAKKSNLRAGVKVVGGGELTKKLTVKVHAVTASAREKIEALGGTVELIQTSSKDKPETTEAPAA